MREAEVGAVATEDGRPAAEHPIRVRSAVIGTGFMGDVHSRAVRAAGGELVCVAGATPEAAEEAATAWGAVRAARDVHELVSALDVDVVHVCTPNSTHVELALAAIQAGKHVICEKPLATDIDGARLLVNAAAEAGVIAAVPFVYRFYPMVREARARILRGDAGEIRLLHGSYLQDWLAQPEADNWRVSAERGGASRAFGDIGVHWVDMVEFVTGHRISRLAASTLIAYPQRGNGGGTVEVTTEDVAALVFVTDQNAVGTATVSQISLGNKNRWTFSAEGDDQSIAFDHEQCDQLTVSDGQARSFIARGGPDAAGDASRFDVVPAGHPQGYLEAFAGFVGDVYAAVRGEQPEGLPTFADGLRAAEVTSAVLSAASTGTWRTLP